MSVYKYVHPDRIDILENGLIRFTQPAALNDPFEAYLCLDQLEASIKRRQVAIVKRMAAQLSAVDYARVMMRTPEKVPQRWHAPDRPQRASHQPCVLRRRLFLAAGDG